MNMTFVKEFFDIRVLNTFLQDFELEKKKMAESSEFRFQVLLMQIHRKVKMNRGSDKKKHHPDQLHIFHHQINGIIQLFFASI